MTGPGFNVSNITYYTSGIQIGLPKSFRHSNNLVTNLTYNSRNFTTSINVGTSTLNLTYGYNSRGNMTAMTSNVNASKHLSPGITLYNHPTNNRLGSTIGAEPSSFTYNTSGDVISYVNHLGEQYNLQYNNLHNLIGYNVHNGPSVATFVYDGDGMRIKKVSSQGTVVYHYDKEGRVISETDQNGNRISDNVYLNGKLIARIGPAGEVGFYHTDPAGTPLAMTDTSGNVLWRADYRPFGEEQIITETVSNNYQFVGKEKDEETGLYYFGARYMESKIGRFISPDPVGPVDVRTGGINLKVLRNSQRINLYVYGLNNPYRYLDSDGKWPEEVHNRIIQVAFSEGKYRLPPHLRQAMEMGSVHVDKDQSKESSYKHAMRAPGQTSQEAERLMNSFIEQKIKEYKELMSQGRTGGAYFRLGEAIHPIMDSTSPSHRGFQEWSLINAPRHLLRETERVFNSNPEYLKKSVDLLKRFYDKIN